MKEVILYREHEIEIMPDEYADSPDNWGNTESFLVYDHRNFCIERKGYDPERIFEAISESKKMYYDGYFVFPVYAYIHSGVSLSLGKSQYPFTCPWDTSMKGFILVERIKGTYTKKAAEIVAESLIENWNFYLSDDVWCYSTDIGSCGGFYCAEGKEQAIKEAKAEIDVHIKLEQEKIDALQYKLDFNY